MQRGVTQSEMETILIHSHHKDVWRCSSIHFIKCFTVLSASTYQDAQLNSSGQYLGQSIQIHSNEEDSAFSTHIYF